MVAAGGPSSDFYGLSRLMDALMPRKPQLMQPMPD